VSKRREKRKAAKADREKRNNSLLQKIRPKTENQAELFDAIDDRRFNYVAVTGPAGTGKSCVASYQAAKLVLQKRYEKIIICRSVTTVAGEDIGYLGGSANQKMAPFMVPFFYNLQKFIPDFKNWIAFNKIEIVPLAFVRGRSFENCIVLVDEAQNVSTDVFRALLTRIADDSKLIFMGDAAQNDKQTRYTDFEKVCTALQGMKSFHWVQLGPEDIIRSRNIAEINDRLDEIS